MSETADRSPDPLPAPIEPAAIAPPERSRKSIAIETGVVILALVLPSAVPGIGDLIQYHGPAPRGDDGTSDRVHLIDHGVFDLGKVAILFYLMWRSGEPWFTFGLSRLRWLADSCRALGILVVLWAERGYFPKLFELSRPAADYMVLAVAYAASGFSQELLYRGYLIPRLGMLLRSSWWGLIISSALFSSVHAYQGIFRVPETFFIGIIYGAFFLWIRRIWPLALAHAIFNFLIRANLWAL